LEGLPPFLSLLRRFNAVVHSIANEMEHGIVDFFEQRAVNSCPLSLKNQIDLLARAVEENLGMM